MPTRRLDSAILALTDVILALTRDYSAEGTQVIGLDKGKGARAFAFAFCVLALLSNLVPAAATLPERVGVATLALVIDAVWYVVVALVLAGTGAVELLRRNGRTMDRVFGVVLLGLAVWLLARELG